MYGQTKYSRELAGAKQNSVDIPGVCAARPVHIPAFKADRYLWPGGPRRVFVAFAASYYTFRIRAYVAYTVGGPSRAIPAKSLRFDPGASVKRNCHLACTESYKCALEHHASCARTLRVPVKSSIMIRNNNYRAPTGTDETMQYTGLVRKLGNL